MPHSIKAGMPPITENGTLIKDRNAYFDEPKAEQQMIAIMIEECITTLLRLSADSLRWRTIAGWQTIYKRPIFDGVVSRPF